MSIEALPYQPITTETSPRNTRRLRLVPELLPEIATEEIEISVSPEVHEGPTAETLLRQLHEEQSLQSDMTSDTHAERTSPSEVVRGNLGSRAVGEMVNDPKNSNYISAKRRKELEAIERSHRYISGLHI